MKKSKEVEIFKYELLLFFDDSIAFKIRFSKTCINRFLSISKMVKMDQNPQ